MSGLNPSGLGRRQSFSETEQDVVSTDSIDNVANHIVGTTAELEEALSDAADPDTDEIYIWIGDGTYTPSNAPYDISDTKIGIKGQFPQITKEPGDPDAVAEPDGGTIIDLQDRGGGNFLTGGFVRGYIGQLWVANAGKAFRFGATDEAGFNWSYMEDVYGYHVDELFHNINSQGSMTRNLRCRRGHHVIHLTTDVTQTPDGEDSPLQGPNSVHIQPFLYSKPLDNGDNPDGGIRIDETADNINPCGLGTFIRPQVNLRSGNAGTGAALALRATNNAITDMNFYGGDFEGNADAAVVAEEARDCKFDLDVAQAETYSIKLVETGIGGGCKGNRVHVGNPNDGTAYTDQPENFITGWVGGFEGPWTGFIADTSTGEIDVLSGRATFREETKIRASLTSDVSIGQGNWANIVDNESADNRGEFNSSFQFTPDRDGFYTFSGTVGIKGGSTGDEIRIRIADVTNNGRAGGEIRYDPVNAAGFPSLPFSMTVELEAGTTYECQVRDSDSDATINSGGGVTSVRIYGELV